MMSNTATITAPTATILSGGALHESAINLMLAGVNSRASSNGVTSFSGVSWEYNIKHDDIKGIVTVGGEVENFKFWFVVDDLSAVVPDFFAGAYETDEQGESSLKTWRQWLDSANFPAVATNFSDGRKAVPGDCHGNMLGSVLAQITSECEVVNTVQIRKMLEIQDEQI